MSHIILNVFTTFVDHGFVLIEFILFWRDFGQNLARIVIVCNFGDLSFGGNRERYAVEFFKIPQNYNDFFSQLSIQTL